VGLSVVRCQPLWWLLAAGQDTYLTDYSHIACSPATVLHGRLDLADCSGVLPTSYICVMTM
jgi:hypothetical protein